MEQPDWGQLTKDWPSGHVKLAWTRHLLKLRTELPGLFTDGDYASLEVTGAHRDHFLGYARRHGRDAVVVVVPRCFAPFTDNGRTWPLATDIDAMLNVKGYAVEGFADADATALRLSDLLKDLPVAVVKAGYHGATKPARKRQLA